MNEERLVFFYPSFERGGATKILVKLINFFLKKKTRIILFSCNCKYNNFIRSKNIKIIGAKINSKSRFYINILTSYYLFKFLKKNLKNKFKVFSLQSHIPVIILSKIFKKKIIIRNSEEIFGATKYAENKLYAFVTFLFKIIFYNFADKIIAISKKSKDSLQAIVIKKKKVKLIYNPYLEDNKKFKFNLNSKTNHNFNILCIGRLTKQKNFSLIIKVVNSLYSFYPNINLTIVGDGPLRQKLIAISGPNIKFVNWCHNIKKYFLKSHLFVLPSYYEGLPNALIDAVYYGIPAISTDCSGARDILRSNKGGFLIPINNSKELQKKIIYTMENYNKTIKKIYYAKNFLLNFSDCNCQKYFKLICNK